MGKREILKEYPQLGPILQGEGIMDSSYVDSIKVKYPSVKIDKYTKTQFGYYEAEFTVIAKGKTLMVYADLDNKNKIIASRTEWPEEFED